MLRGGCGKDEALSIVWLRDYQSALCLLGYQCLCNGIPYGCHTIMEAYPELVGEHDGCAS